LVISQGPDYSPSITNPADAFPAFYDPTNGVLSRGDIIVVGSR